MYTIITNIHNILFFKASLRVFNIKNVNIFYVIKSFQDICEIRKDCRYYLFKVFLDTEKFKKLIIKVKLGRLRTHLLLKLENKGFTTFSSGKKE